jgi:hypothetical protein
VVRGTTGGTVALAVTVPSGEIAGMRARRPRPAPAPRSAFAGFRFPPEVIVIAVRWYLRYALSSRDVEELMVERGVESTTSPSTAGCCASPHC